MKIKKLQRGHFRRLTLNCSWTGSNGTQSPHSSGARWLLRMTQGYIESLVMCGFQREGEREEARLGRMVKLNWTSWTFSQSGAVFGHISAVSREFFRFLSHESFWLNSTQGFSLCFFAVSPGSCTCLKAQCVCILPDEALSTYSVAFKLGSPTLFPPVGGEMRRAVSLTILEI